jgi:hypothetical protein
MQLSKRGMRPSVPRQTYHALFGSLEVLIGLGQLRLVVVLIGLLGLDDGVSLGVVLGSSLCGARCADLGGGGSSEFSHGEIV